MKEKKYIKWIDVAKGICLIAVILGHCNEELVKYVFPFHLPVFFIISGYTISNTKIDKDNLSKKFKRLMSPYFITCFFIILMDVLNLILLKDDKFIVSITSKVMSNINRSFFGSGAITSFGNLNFSSRIGAIWFLPALFFSIITSYFILNKEKRYWKRFLFSALISLIAYILSKFIFLPFSILSGLFAVPFIIFGKWLKDNDILEKLKIRHYLLFILIYIYSIVKNLGSISIVNAAAPDIIFTFLSSISASLLVISLSVFISRFKFSNIFSYIGKRSLTGLCVHLFALETMILWFHEWFDMQNYLTRYIVEISFVIIILLLKDLLKYIKSKINLSFIKKDFVTNRNITIDILRGMLIISMMVGYNDINTEFRKMIFSVHMCAFIFLSGYLYKDKGNLLKSVFNEIKRMIIPVSLFVVLYILKNNNLGFKQIIINLLANMSFSKNILKSVGSIGPFYFVYLLFLTKIIYLIIDKTVKDKFLKITIIGLLVILGIELGNNGYWLPWSLDVSLYCLIFYYIGTLFKQYKVIEYFIERKYYYFILSPIWLYMVYMGSMELSIRKYSPYGLVIFGCLSGIIILFMLSESLKKRMGQIFNRIISYIGSSTIYILIIHTLFNGMISYELLHKRININTAGIPNMVISIAIQLIIGCLLNCIIMSLKKLFAHIRLSSTKT